MSVTLSKNVVLQRAHTRRVSGPFATYDEAKWARASLSMGGDGTTIDEANPRLTNVPEVHERGTNSRSPRGDWMATDRNL